MGLGDRTKEGIERWFIRPPAPDTPAWGDRLSTWGADLLEKGATKLLEGAEPQTKELMRGTLTKMLENPGMTPELREVLEASLEKGDWVATVMGWIGMVIGSILGLISMGAPAGRVQEYNVDRIAESFRLDPISAITAWRRDPETYAGLFDDLKDQGWSADRIEALKFFTEFMPSAQDLVTWLAREVFEPEMRAKYGLDDESDKLDLSLFAKIGVSQEQALNYWRAHWEHPEFRTVVEMLRRTDFTEDDMRDWFRLVEIPPYWRNKLIEISWEVPTRVDVRRFWDMGTINEVRLREIYTAQGYHGDDLDDYVLWTKVYVAFPDLVARYKNGWLTLDQVKSNLVELGMTAERAQELLETKFKAAEEERTTAEKTKTRSDIIKGVKQGTITRAQAVELLQDLNYSADEAQFILDVNITVDDEDEVVALRQLSKSDILKALKTEVITEPDAQGRLQDLRYSPADANLLLTIFRATIVPPVEEESRELAKGDITGALRRGILSPDEARGMLVDIGYSTVNADFLVEANEPPLSAIEAEESRAVGKADIMKALLAGVIDRAEAETRLEELEYSTEDAAWLVTLYLTVANITTAPVSREASKADIIAAVKKGLLTQEEAYLMLQGIGFSPDGSQFILDVRTESSPFSLRGFEEFKDRTGLWRQTVRADRVPDDDELRAAGAELVKVTEEVKLLRAAVEKERGTLVYDEEPPPSATVKLRGMQVAVNRAEAELERVQRVYDTLVTRHKWAAE